MSDEAITDKAIRPALLEAVDRYFEMMFDSNVSRFDHVFAPTAKLHGLRDGQMRVLPAAEYRKLLAATLAKIEGGAKAAGGSADRLRLADAGAGQAPRADRYDPLPGLPAVPHGRWHVACHREIVSHRAAVRSREGLDGDGVEHDLKEHVVGRRAEAQVNECAWLRKRAKDERKARWPSDVGRAAITRGAQPACTFNKCLARFKRNDFFRTCN